MHVMKTNANYQQIANARKAAAKAAAAARMQVILNRRAVLQANAAKRKARRQLLRARRNYSPGWSEAFPDGSGHR